MRWATFRTAEDPGIDRVGPVLDGKVFALPPGMRLADLIKDGQESLLKAGEGAIRAPASTHDIADVRPALECVFATAAPPSIVSSQRRREGQHSPHDRREVFLRSTEPLTVTSA